MSITIVTRARAQSDVRSAAQWYETQREGLGIEFADELQDAISAIEQNPELHSVYYGPYRCAYLDRFPYKIFYRIRGQRVYVSRVLHAKRDHTRLLK
jgi:plasmid stabilization system protein ParE